MSDKLHIPGPDEREDLTELNITIVIAWAVCMLLCIGLFFFFRDRRPAPAPKRPADPVVARQETIVKKAKYHHGHFDQLDLSGQNAVAVFRHGPRKAAEAACKELRPKLADGTLSGDVAVELLKAVDRRAEHAPWTCLMRAFFAKKISPELDLFSEMSEVWKQMQRFEMPAPIVTSVLDDFRKNRNRPDQPAFYSWLRLCGLNADYGARDACVKILYQISPKQGRDMLDMVEKHFQARDPQALAKDMPVLIHGVGDLAQRGQPKGWRVDKTDHIDDYDAALRLGATFVLCRIVNTPDDKIARTAAVELAQTADMAARLTDKNLLLRWRKSCGLAFRQKAAGKKAADNTESANALAVWNGKKGTPPNYALAWAQKRGDCPADDPRPSWYCGVGLWQGKGDQGLALTLMGFFTDTRYVEWQGVMP